MSKSAATTGPMLSVRQVRSGIGFNKRQKATLRALGLGRPGTARQLPDNPQVRAMVASIPHLVEIDSAERSEGRE